jgi:hypothetical protein
MIAIHDPLVPQRTTREHLTLEAGLRVDRLAAL